MIDDDDGDLVRFDYFTGFPLSHTRTVVQECFKGDEKEKAKIRPLATPKPLNRSSKIGRRDCVMDGTRHAKFCSDRFRGFCSPNTWFCWAFGVTSFLFVFWGSLIRLQPTPLDGYLRKIRQMTSFWVRKCLLGVPMTTFYIWTLKFPKNYHFGDRFWLDSFLRPKTALTWGCSNINYP